MDVRENVAPQEYDQRHVDPFTGELVLTEVVCDVRGNLKKPTEEIRLVLNVVAWLPWLVEIVYENRYLVMLIQNGTKEHAQFMKFVDVERLTYPKPLLARIF